MEIKNFNGKAIEIIESYINESPSMDTYINQNFVSLVASIVRGANIPTLLDIYNDLDLKYSYLEREIHSLQHELASRKSKLKVYNSEEEHKSITGEEVMTLAREINEKSSRKGYCTSIKDVTEAIKDYTEENLTGKIDNLSDEERLELTNSLLEIIDKNTSKISTLNKEISSRTGKMNSPESIKTESELFHITKEEYMAKTHNEISERDHRRKVLEHYNQVLQKFTPQEDEKTPSKK